MDIKSKPPIFALVAGEASGDILGEGLIISLKKQYPKATFIGIGGPLMQAQGLKSLFDMDRLSVMGLVEVLGRLKELLGIRKSLFEQFTSNPPDVFIGIDAPDFNLPLARKLKQQNIKTIQYVSPSVWAWRQKRVFKIAKSINSVLCLLPFEAAFFHKYNVDARFIGHRLADEIPFEPDMQQARESLQMSDGPWLALMPGSRGGEISRMAPVYLQSALELSKQNQALKFIVPLNNNERKKQFLEIKNQVAPNLDVKIVMSNSRSVLQACDWVLLTSGTAALEAMLMKKPMIVAYKTSWLTYAIASRMVKIPFVSLPNILAGKQLVPELIQDNATVEKLTKECQLMMATEKTVELKAAFTELHKQIKKDADQRAAEAVIDIAQI